MALGKRKYAVSPETHREIEPELMTNEEQAEHVSSLYALRGSARQIDGVTMKLKGLMMRSNALLHPDRIAKAYDELEALIKAGRVELKRISA